MKFPVLLTLGLALVATGCSTASRFDEGDGGTEDGDPSDGGMDGRSTGGGGSTTGSSGGRNTGVGSDWDGGFEGGQICDPNGICCDEFGDCCFAGLGVCWNQNDGGAPFPFFPGYYDGGTGFEITEDPWEPPPTVEVTQPTSSSKPVWRNSTEPLCTERQNWVSTYSLWSDERGVFALLASDGYYDGFYGYPPPDGGTGDCENCPRITLWHNDGDGWEPYLESDQPGYFYSEHQLAGIPNGPLFAYGYGDTYDGAGCGLATITQDALECQPIYEASAISVVDDTLAYAIADGSLIRYQNGRWGPYPGVLNGNLWLTSLWADATTIFASGGNAGQWLQLQDDQWVVLDTGTLERFQTLWGYSATDVYAGSEQGGLYHYDGTSVTEIDWDYEACEFSYPNGIRNIWGADGVTYFHTSNQLAKLEDGSVEILAEWPCEYDGSYEPPAITSVWGNGPNEVFISLTDMRQPRQECGITFVLYYDGRRLSRL